jgi:hypothetical protein
MRLQLLKKSQQGFIYVIFLLVITISHPAYADEEIEVNDIRRFGKNLVNTKVFFKATLITSNECKLASNNGFYCVMVRAVADNGIDWVLVADDKYHWHTYKNWLDTKAILLFRGTIEMREESNVLSGLRSVSPVFIAQDISPITKN